MDHEERLALGGRPARNLTPEELIGLGIMPYGDTINHPYHAPLTPERQRELDNAATLQRKRRAKSVLAENYDPPAGWRTFYVKRIGSGSSGPQSRVGALSDEELAWVARVVIAELERRRGARQEG